MGALSCAVVVMRAYGFDFITAVAMSKTFTLEFFDIVMHMDAVFMSPPHAFKSAAASPTRRHEHDASQSASPRASASATD